MVKSVTMATPLKHAQLHPSNVYKSLSVSTVHTKNNFTTIIYQYAYEYIHVYVNEQNIDVHIYVYIFHS